MTNCDKFVTLFSDYIDGTLANQQKSEFRQHIDQCRKCADTLSGMRVIKTHLKELTPVKTSNTFHVVLRSRIRRELERATLRDRFIVYIQTHRLPAFATSFAALIVISFITFNTFYKTDQTSETSVPLVATQDQVREKQTAQPVLRQQYYFVVEEMEESTIKNLFSSSGQKINSQNLEIFRRNEMISDENGQTSAPILQPETVTF